MTPDRRGHGDTAILKRQVIVLERAGGAGGGGCGRLLEGGRGGSLGRSGCGLGCGRGRTVNHYCTCGRRTAESSLGGLAVALLLVGRGLLGRSLLITALCRLLVALRCGRLLSIGLGVALRGDRRLLIPPLRVGILLALGVALLRVCLRGIHSIRTAGLRRREQMKLGDVNFSGISLYSLLVVV